MGALGGGWGRDGNYEGQRGFWGGGFWGGCGGFEGGWRSSGGVLGVSSHISAAGSHPAPSPCTALRSSPPSAPRSASSFFLGGGEGGAHHEGQRAPGDPPHPPAAPPPHSPRVPAQPHGGEVPPAQLAHHQVAPVELIADVHRVVPAWGARRDPRGGHRTPLGDPPPSPPNTQDPPRHPGPPPRIRKRPHLWVPPSIMDPTLIWEPRGFADPLPILGPPLHFRPPPTRLGDPLPHFRTPPDLQTPLYTLEPPPFWDPPPILEPHMI